MYFPCNKNIVINKQNPISINPTLIDGNITISILCRDTDRDGDIFIGCEKAQNLMLATCVRN